MLPRGLVDRTLAPGGDAGHYAGTGFDGFESNGLRKMPTLFRLLLVLGLIGGLGYGAVWALANLVDPAPRQITITVPQERIGK